MGKRREKRDKNDLPVFDADADFLREFEKKNKTPDADKEKATDSTGLKNRHGLTVLASNESDITEKQEETADFASLLEESFRKKRPVKKRSNRSMPVKKRLKRYPQAERDVDLHGYTAIGAEVKARSFIHTCKQQGYFTIRIIVGKGLHSDLGPVLPDVVEDVAKELKRQGIVLSYQWEKKKKASSGALIVYLKQFDRYD